VVFDPSPIGFNDNAPMWLTDISFASDVRAETDVRPQRHGGILDPGKRGSGLLDCTAKIVATEDTLEANRTSLVKVLNSILGEDGTGTMRWTNQGSSNPLALTGLYLVDGPVFTIDNTTWDIHFVLQSEKPFAEDAEATIVDSVALTASGGGFTIPLTIPVTFTSSGGGTLTVSNAGDFKAYPVVRVYGPITNPVVTNNTAGKSLVFTGSIASGDYWEIDLFANTVLINGVSDAPVTTIDVAQSTWFGCALGDTSLQLTGTGFDTNTKLRALFKSAWG